MAESPSMQFTSSVYYTNTHRFGTKMAIPSALNHQAALTRLAITHLNYQKAITPNLTRYSLSSLTTTIMIGIDIFAVFSYIHDYYATNDKHLKILKSLPFMLML